MWWIKKQSYQRWQRYILVSRLELGENATLIVLVKPWSSLMKCLSNQKLDKHPHKHITIIFSNMRRYHILDCICFLGAFYVAQSHSLCHKACLQTRFTFRSFDNTRRYFCMIIFPIFSWTSSYSLCLTIISTSRMFHRPRPLPWLLSLHSGYISVPGIIELNVACHVMIQINFWLKKVFPPLYELYSSAQMVGDRVIR